MVGDRTRNGWYLTIWRREATGKWKFILDCGTDADAGVWTTTGQDVEYTTSSVASRKRPDGSADHSAQAKQEVQELELASARDATLLAGLFAQEVRFVRPGSAARSPAASAASFPRGTKDEEIEIMGSGAARSGDLAYTYGRISWKDAVGHREGYWIRIWQKRGNDWKIVVDRFAPVPPESR